MFEIHFKRGTQDANGSITDDDINALEILAKPAEGFGDTVRIAYIRLGSESAPAHFADGIDHRFSFLVTVVVGNRHIATSRGQLQRDRATNAAGAAGNKRDSSCKGFAHEIVPRTEGSRAAD